MYVVGLWVVADVVMWGLGRRHPHDQATMVLDSVKMVHNDNIFAQDTCI